MITDTIQTSVDFPKTFLELVFSFESTEFDKKDILQAVQIWEVLTKEAETFVAESKREATPKIGDLSRFLFKRKGFRACAKSRRQSTLCGALLDNCGSCLGLTTVYYCLGRILGIPLCPLLYENHIAISLEKTSPPVHVEMTRFGKMISPHFQQIIYGQPVMGRAMLDENQFMAVHFSSRAVTTMIPNRLYDDAVSLFDASLELYPEYLAAYVNRAIALFEMGHIDKALKSLEFAETLVPQRYCRRSIDKLYQIIRNP